MPSIAEADAEEAPPLAQQHRIKCAEFPLQRNIALECGPSEVLGIEIFASKRNGPVFVKSVSLTCPKRPLTRYEGAA